MDRHLLLNVCSWHTKHLYIFLILKKKKIRSIYEKGFKSILTAAIVLSAVACSTTNDEETKTKETKEKIVEQRKIQVIPKEVSVMQLHKAENYSKMMHMSKQRIYDQLTSEYGDQFDVEVAQYAIDNLNVDYKENALKCGENYKKTMHMSKARIYDHLNFAEFV